MQGVTFSNWAKTYSCTPRLYYEPTQIEDVIEIVAKAKKERRRVRVVGIGHSPSTIACTDDFMISLRKMNRILEIDTKRFTVKFEAGVTVAQLNETLPSHGMALSNQGSIGDITVAGAIATGTHGTGIAFGTICSHVLSVDLLLASEKIVECSRDVNSDVFYATMCGLGATGILLSVTLQCEPAFHLHQRQFSSTLQEVLDDLESLVNSSEHFRFCWYPHTENVVYWKNSRTSRPPVKCGSWFWDYAIGYYSLEFVYWLSSFFPSLVPSIAKSYFNLLYKHPREVIDRSDKVFSFECLFKQYVMEWAIPRRETANILLQLKKWIEKSKFPAHFPVEVRFVKAEEFFLSPAYNRDSCYINIVMYRPYGKDISHHEYWHAFEKIVLSAGGRPHWAKDHGIRAKEFAGMYPRFGKYLQVRESVDPSGLFLNEYLEHVLVDESK